MCRKASNMKHHPAILLAVVLLFVNTISVTAQEVDTAQTEELSTDRPDQTEAPRLVPKGSLQIEAGVMSTRFREADENGGQTAATGMLFLRYGLAKRVELRLVLEEGRLRDRFIQETTQGLYPLAAGTKVALIKEQKGLLPEASLLGYLNLPYLARADSQRNLYSPAIIAAFENKFLKKWEIEYNAGWKRDAFDTDYEWMASASLHYELTDKLTIFGEYFGHYQSGDPALHNADGGLLYLLAENIQADFAIGSSIQADPENRNFFGTVGLSIRLPE